MRGLWGLGLFRIWGRTFKLSGLGKDAKKPGLALGPLPQLGFRV